MAFVLLYKVVLLYIRHILISLPGFEHLWQS